MSDYSRRTVRFDAKGDKKLKLMTKKENELRSQRGLEKISENTMIMDCIDYRYKEVYDKSRLKKEAEEEKIFYAKLNDKIISKYFNLLMDLLEAEVERINDLKLQISLLSNREGTFEDVSKKGISRIIEDLNDDEELFRKIKKEYKKANPEILYEADIKKEDKEEKEDDREFF